MMRPSRQYRYEDGAERPFLVWRFTPGRLMASTASAGGGIGLRRWIINAEVHRDYARTDLADHASELAASAGLSGRGMTLFTAARVRHAQYAEAAGATAEVTVGLSQPTWAARAAARTATPARRAAPRPGTINIVAQLPVRLSDAALAGALCTATEAKTQALFEAGIPGTGTASDAVVVVCPPHGDAEVFAGVRSVWGARLACAVHDAVAAGIRVWLAGSAA